MHIKDNKKKKKKKLNKQTNKHSIVFEIILIEISDNMKQPVAILV